MRKIRNILLIILFILINACALINFHVINYSKEYITDEISSVDAILVLGAGIKDGKPSLMLQERLDKALELYEKGVSDKILVSGDHGSDSHDEVNVMKNYLIKKGIPSSNIFMDHAGFSTYESIVRAKEIFEVSSAVIVTQEYHLYRAIYIAKKYNLDVYGVSATKNIYFGQTKRNIREMIARVKDYIYVLIKVDPTYLGEIIPITGDGNITNDLGEV